ncbi:unnamed protein product [Brassica rapa subsp. narinosa]
MLLFRTPRLRLSASNDLAKFGDTWIHPAGPAPDYRPSFRGGSVVTLTGERKELSYQSKIRDTYVEVIGHSRWLERWTTATERTAAVYVMEFHILSSRVCKPDSSHLTAYGGPLETLISAFTSSAPLLPLSRINSAVSSSNVTD